MNELTKDINEWFPKLPESIRESLTSNPEQTLNVETQLAIITARGYGAPIVGWADVPGSETAHLNGEEQDWIKEHGRN